MAATKKTDVRLADEDIVIFIELFHEHDCLWNVGSANYHKKEHRLTALRAIVAEMETRTGKTIGGKYWGHFTVTGLNGVPALL